MFRVMYKVKCHYPRFNHDMQLEIDCYEWVIGKIEVNKIPFDRLERIIKATIKGTDIDNSWTKIQPPRWILFVILAIRNDRMAVI
jgi:hypothetical protein